MHALPLLRADIDDLTDQVMADPEASRRPGASPTPSLPSVAATALDTSPYLPRLSAAAASGLTHAYAALAPLPLTLGGVDYQVRWRVDAEPTLDANAYRFVVGPAYGTLWIDPSAEVAWLGDAADPSVPAVLRAALLADLCAPLITALQALTRQRVELLPPAAESDASLAPHPEGANGAGASRLRSAPATLRFELRRSDNDWFCHGALLFDAPDALGVFFAAPPQAGGSFAPSRTVAAQKNASAFAALPVPLAFELGRTSLTAQELADVLAGDIIAIEHWRAEGQNLLCVAQVPARPAWEITGRPSGNRLVVERIREMPLEPSQSSEAPRTQPASPEDSGAAPSTARHFDGLAVEVTFQLPSCTMPLGELSVLQPGGVIELQQGINQSVINIVANGMLVGTGHLIAVGQKLGVRVTTLTPPASQAPRERQDG
ncbi:type III secretion system cytoplasmic ring protein SctQ [Paraburkholderia sp.]|uniref:type III secretion system cytoplasmic ring protein SctQ n=1 Tax=Paraburkholderia sp. TaxID=1926495 RepID=UPI0039C962E9